MMANKQSDEGITLHVWATYTDSTGSDKTATKAADNKVVVNRENRTPEFREGGDKPVMQATRSVAENTMAVSTDDDTAEDGDTDDNIGMPVNATDMSVPTDTLTYTLAGRDAAMFRVRQDNPITTEANEGGQIEVGAGTMLDYEKKKSYMVMLTATDPSLASATIDVTINVMDEDEPPDFTTDGPFKKDIRENPSSLRIETFRATDPDRPQRTVYWELAEAAVSVDGVEVASTG